MKYHGVSKRNEMKTDCHQILSLPQKFDTISLGNSLQMIYRICVTQLKTDMQFASLTICSMIFVPPKEKRQGAHLGTGGWRNKSELQLIELCWDNTIVNVYYFSFVHIPGFLLTCFSVSF